MNIEDQVKGSILHVFNFMIWELITQCFRLAFENELSDLKGLVVPDSICTVIENDYLCCSVEMELLGMLDDEPIKQMLMTIDEIRTCSDTYLNINNLDWETLLTEDIHHENGSESFHSYVFELECNGTYEDIRNSIYDLYITFEQVLFHCAHQLLRGELEVYDEIYDLFWEHDGEVETDDTNARLLLELMQSLRYDS